MLEVWRGGEEHIPITMVRLMGLWLDKSGRLTKPIAWTCREAGRWSIRSMRNAVWALSDVCHHHRGHLQ